MGLFFVVLDYGIEAGAAAAAGDADGINIQVDGEYAAFVAFLDLVGDVEDQGGVETVVEGHLDFHVVLYLGAHHLLVAGAGAGDSVGVDAG